MKYKEIMKPAANRPGNRENYAGQQGRSTHIMLTDIEIAQSARLLPIEDIAGKLGIGRSDLELYGDR
jgi:hypothetical protein